MTREQRLRKRFARLRKLEDADLPASLILQAETLLRDDPEFGPAWSILGRALTELARHTEAQAAISRAISLCPKEKVHIPLSQMGHLCDFRGDWAEAEEWYRKAIEARPNCASAHIYLGAIMARQGRLDEAEMTHRAATRCVEGCIDEAYLNLGFVLRAQERFVEAFECFTQVIELDPEDRMAKRALRDVRRAMKLASP